MTDLFVGVAATCVVQILETELQPRADGWTESLHLEIAARAEGPDAGSCPSVTLPLPSGARWTRTRGRTELTDGTRHRLRDFRFETTAPLVDRSRSTVVHVPELQPGDRVVLDLVRELPPGPLRYDATGRFVRLASDATLDGALTRDGDALWGRDVLHAEVTVRSALQTEPTDLALAPAPADTAIAGQLRLIVPQARDPLVTLYPGGGSALETTLFVTLPPHDAAIGWVVPAPVGADVSATVAPPSRAAVTTVHGITRIEAPPSEGPSQVSVRFTTPDAPTYGSIPGDLGPGSPGAITDWQVEVDRGVIAWDDEHRRWALTQLDGRPIVPDRTRFVRALANRFDGRSVPEPGIPQSLRGVPPSPELAAALPGVLRSLVGIAEVPHDPLWPRKLRRARRSGAVTPTEAALLGWLMARQIGFDATWALVRPGAPAADFVSPAGFDRPLVVLFGLDDGPRFLDPACAECGPFELPQELWGSAALSPRLDRLPAAENPTFMSDSEDLPTQK